MYNKPLVYVGTFETRSQWPIADPRGGRSQSQGSGFVGIWHGVEARRRLFELAFASSLEPSSARRRASPRTQAPVLDQVMAAIA